MRVFLQSVLFAVLSAVVVSAEEQCTSAYVIPDIPRLESATFSSDGSYLTAVFDSDVDATAVIGATSSFVCGVLFSFPGASSSATCQFTSGRTAVAYLNGASIVNVDDIFAVRGGTITAKCPSDYPASCCRAFEAVPDGSVTIVPPAVVTTPVVVLPSKIITSICAPPSIDLSMSYGSGGRLWETVTVSVVTESPDGPALRDFLVASSFLTKAVKINSNLLTSGASYAINVELCNFLGGCASAGTVIDVNPTAVPYVSIAGAASTSVDVFSVLKLEASAELPLCGNSLVPVSLLDFTWSVTRDDVVVAVTQISRDKTKFHLPAYALESGATYKVICTVHNTEDAAQTSFASVTVVVNAGSVVAVLAGAASRLLPFQKPIVLNGAGSFDGNIGSTANSNLAFTFSCAQTAPTALASCPMLSLSRSGGLLTVANVATVYAPYSYVITMRVADASNATRTASAAVSVKLLQSTAPLVEVSRGFDDSKFNAHSSLTLNGAVTLLDSESQNAAWTVDDAILAAKLSSISLTSITRTLASKGTHNVALVLKPGVLTRGTTYVFTLTCGSSKASLTVTVNDPPRPGNFVVSPPSGTEISDSFEFSTSFWTDEDTPIEFEFGFISNKGVRLVLQPRSRLTSLTTSLPAGQDVNSYVLQTYVRVFDSLNAVQQTTFAVTVNPAASSEELLGDLSDAVTGAGTVGSLKQALSLVTSVINAKDCSAAPDCDALNRASCGSVVDTCGACQDDFYGDVGAQNSLCVSAETLAEIQASKGVEASCDAGNPCLAWYTCGDGVCVPDSKQCIDDCSGHGECGFVHTGTGFSLSECPLYDFQCAAECICDTGYYGSACATAEVDLTQRLGLRTQVLSGLQQIADSDNPSADAALSLIASLSAATDQADEISSAAADTAILVADGILAGGQLGSLSADQLTGLLSSLDAVLVSSASATSPGRRALSAVATVRKSVINSLDNYGLLLGDEHLVAGQQSQASSQKLFKTSAQVFGAGDEVSAQLMSDSGGVGSSVSLNDTEADGELLIVLSSIDSKLYMDVDLPITSDGIRAVVRGRNVSKSFTFVIRHNQEVEYSQNDSAVFFVTECTKKVELYEFVCPSDGYVITHNCDGTRVKLTSQCPGTKIVSRCQNLDDTADITLCEVLSYDAASTTCACTVTPSGRRLVTRGGRALISEEDIGYVEVAAISEQVASDFAGTAMEARNFNSLDDVAQVLTVIIMFGVMWVVGLGMTWYYAVRGATKDRKVELNEQLNLQRKMAAASTKTSVDKIKKYLDAYVTEVFPVVFRPSPWHERLITEIKKHHRYLTIFTGGGDPRVRLMTTVHLLTIQTMLMFILAVFYDIQFPVDDGTCEKLSADTCEDEKSIFDNAKSKCRWASGPDACEFVEPKISEHMIVLISIIVAIATAPINLVVDFIFDDILSAPTADSVKLNAEPNALQRAGKQLNAARRASVSAIKRASVNIQGAITPRRRQSSKLLHTTTTRMIPESTISAQSLANASVTEALGVFKDSQQKYEDERNAILGTSTAKSFVNVSNRRARATRIAGVAVATESRLPVQVTTALLPEAGVLGLGSAADVRFAELSKEIVAQRRRLKPSEQEDFDLRWGFDPNGEFTRSDGALSALICRKSGPEAVLKKELEYVQKETEEKYEKLRIATDAHTGLEMLHLFVLDLLGRDTPAALIFSSKTSEDFRHAMIVSKNVKIVCWIFIVLLNIVFVFFAMLRGMERGKSWQMGYAIACIIQFVVEIFMFETIECIWVHYLIPDAASAEIYAAQHSLKRTINSLCSTMSASATYVLDVPKYLFVSTNVAERFPDMLESMIIRSYHYHLPGELEKKWRVSHDRDSVVMRFLRNFSIFAITISILQFVGSSPSSLQRAVIHTLNPLLFGGVFILVLFLYNNPVYLTVIAGVVVYKLVHYMVKEFMKRRAENRPKKFDRIVSNVVPVPSGDRSGSAGSNRSARSINSISVAPLPVIDGVNGHVELSGATHEEGVADSINESSNSDSDSDNASGDEVAERDETAAL